MQDKNKWHRRTTAFMGQVAKELGIPRNKRTIHSNKGGNAVGGEVTMSAPEFGVYVHLTCPVNSYGMEDRIGSNYVRRATADDPYGTAIDKQNHFLTTQLNPTEIADFCRKIVT
jgi:hypothetical protein